MTIMKRYILTILIILFYAVTIPLNTALKSSRLEESKEPDIIQNMFGGMRSFVADWAFMKAEEYHHRGLPFVESLSYHHGQSTLMEEAHGPEEEEHHHAEGEVKNDLFSRIYRSVKVTEDSHLAPSENKEVLPWFYTEVLFNPHDIRGYILGGYWLQTMGRYEESLKFLKDGRKNNPDSAQICASLGGSYYRNKNIEEAVFCLERARMLWLKGAPPNVVSNDYMITDRLMTYDLLGHIYETMGQYEKALEIYTEYKRFGLPSIMDEKIIKLKNIMNAVK